MLWRSVREKKSVQFNEEVQVKTVEVVEEEVTIDEVSAHTCTQVLARVIDILMYAFCARLPTA